MAILLGRPPSRPAGPRRVGRADGIIAPLEGIKEGLVGGQGLLGDHVPDEDDEEVVGDASGSVPQFLRRLEPIGL